MTKTLSVTLMVGIILYFGIIVSLLKKKVLSLKYTLLWLLTGAGLLFLLVFPDVSFKISKFFGFQMPVNGMFLFMIAFLSMIVLSMTVIVSGQSERIKIMAQKMALLEKRVRDYEKNE